MSLQRVEHRRKIVLYFALPGATLKAVHDELPAILSFACVAPPYDAKGPGVPLQML